MQLPPDTLLQGRYRVVALIAQGGMGAVYRAVDERLGHTVALKQTLVADPALRAAFEREARLLAGLHHPALPVVSDHFAEGGGQFLVMQYIPGDDLAALLKARGAPFPPDQALAWADDILDALEHLHGRQPPVVHRDIKPQNLKLAPHGGVVLLDFGLAKGLAGAGNSASPSLFGYTPQYAPIEQIQGAGTGPRSDLYSLAATLYELLAGAPPPDALARVAATLRGAPDPLRPLLEIDPGLPAHAAAALDQALALNQDLRPPSAAAMRAALGSVAPALAPPPRPGASEGAHARAAGPGPAATGPTIVAPPPGDRAATGPTIAQPRPRRLYPRTAL
ncbi:MAG TPA: serine/threonine-protein kinase, partial [Chloroflexaceae bacterium]|nr:serine/threonine-protein kinase [Chloroflexaceae bacterium]